MCVYLCVSIFKMTSAYLNISRFMNVLLLFFLTCVSVCHSQTEMNMYKDVCYYMIFALAAYGWPMYLMRKPACGLCRLASSCP